MSGAMLALLLTVSGAGARAVPLPGGGPGIGFDDLVSCVPLRRVLVPAGRTGRLDLVDPETGAVEAIAGFTVREAPTRGHGDAIASADCGGGRIFAIDRSRRTVAVIDPAARRIEAEAPLAGAPDYVRWVEPRREVWVTEPDRERIEIFRFEAGARPALVRAAEIDVRDGPESLVVDPSRGRAYTNTWHHTTLAIALDSRAVDSRWENGCAGGRGIALDEARGLLLVGCAEGRAVALDLGRGGAVAGSARAGAGVDVIAFEPARAHLYLAAARAAELTVVGVGARGELRVLGALPTAPGAHCVAAGGRRAYVCDPQAGRLLELEDPFPSSR